MAQKMITPNYSHSLLATWRRCRQRFAWRYLEGVPSPAGIGQVKGTAGHAALAEWHRDYDAIGALETARRIFDATLTNNGLSVDDQTQKAWDELEEALGRYFPYSETTDKFTLLKPELHFEIDVNGQTFKGYIDAVVEEPNGRVWLMEHKFLKRVNTKHLDLDPQVSLYMLAARLLGYEPQGVFYNIIRMGGGPTARREPVVRKYLYRNPEGLTATANELQLQIAEIENWLALPATDRIVYRNPTRDCTWDCSYYNACLSIEDSGEGDSVLAAMRKEYPNA